MYSKNIINRFQNLQNVGLIKNSTVSGEVENKDTKALLRVYLNIENGVITLAKFKCYANVLTTVCADVLCDNLMNKNIDEIENIGIGELLTTIGEVNDISTLEFVLSVTSNLIKEYNKKLEKEQKAKK